MKNNAKTYNRKNCRAVVKSLIAAGALLCLSGLCLPAIAAPADASARTDRALAAEIRSFFAGGSYPAAVSTADTFLDRFPRSEFTAEVQYLKAESLYRLGRYDEALRIVSVLPETPETCSFMARAECGKGNYTGALRLAYAAIAGCTDASARNTPYYADAVVAAGKSLVALGKNAEATAVLETLFYAGLQVKLSATGLYDAVSSVFTAYKNCGSYGKLISLYDALRSRLAEGTFPPQAFDRLQLDAADSYAATGNSAAAVEIYLKLLASQNKQIAVAALQKAYVLCTEQPASSGVAESELMNRASSLLSGYPEILAEFWVRAGIDAWNKKNTGQASLYFDRADAYAVPQLLQLTALYRSRLLAPAAAVQLLERTLDSGSAYYTDYLIELAFCSIGADDWNKAEKYAVKLEKTKNCPPEYTLAAGYIRACSAYRAGKYDESVLVLEKIRASVGGSFPAGETGMQLCQLYAQSLFNCNRTEDACAVFDELAVQALAVLERKQPEHRAPAHTASAVLVDSARASFAAGRYDAAYRIAVRASKDAVPELRIPAEYTAALAALSHKEWAQAETLFLHVSAAGGNQPYMQYAPYYAAYASYRLEKYADAYNRFESCAAEMQNRVFAWNAGFFAAKCAAGEYARTKQPVPWLVRAVQAAEQALAAAFDDTQRIDAVLLAAGVYTDAGRYDDALKLLASGVNRNTEFGMVCLYRSAQIYALQKQYARAADTYGDLEKRFAGQILAEEAAYRRGELYYNAGDWQQASAYLSRYRKQYPDGQFAAAALCFSADSCFRQNNDGQALLLSKELIRAYPDSPYVYQTQKNLIALYRKRGEYKNAYAVAREQLLRFGEQARKDGVESLISELSLLASGDDEKTAALYTRFMELGAEKTPEGRDAGLQLAAVYIGMPERRKDGISLTERIRKQCGESAQKDRQTAAAADFMLGSCRREDAAYQSAITLFLSAARLYASSDHESAAHSLYCALEAMDCAGLAGDAAATYKTLQADFSDSVWTVRAAAIVKE